MIILTAIFLILHGLVHFLYFGQSARFWELKPGIKWPDEAWLFAPFFRKKAIRVLACNFCILGGIGFIVSGITVFELHSNWYLLSVGSAIFSIFIYLSFWNGKLEKLNEQGVIAIIIDMIIINSIVFHHWPKLGF